MNKGKIYLVSLLIGLFVFAFAGYAGRADLWAELPTIQCASPTTLSSTGCTYVQTGYTGVPVKLLGITLDGKAAIIAGDYVQTVNVYESSSLLPVYLMVTSVGNNVVVSFSGLSQACASNGVCYDAPGAMGINCKTLQTFSGGQSCAYAGRTVQLQSVTSDGKAVISINGVSELVAKGMTSNNFGDLKINVKETGLLSNSDQTKNFAVLQFSGVTPSCTETDSGLDYHTKGTLTTANGLQLTDSCGTGQYTGYVIEYYCSNTFTDQGSGAITYTPAYYQCANGCTDGACIYTTPGCAQSGRGCFSDSECCSGLTCQSGTCAPPTTTCKSAGQMCGGIAGFQCCSGLNCQMNGNYPDASGTCVSTPQPPQQFCTDTDGGVNYTVKGTATWSVGNAAATGTDFCDTTTKLKEYSCSGNTGVQTTYTCPNGCSNGACVSGGTCKALGQTCSGTSSCCDGLTCQSGTCIPSTCARQTIVSDTTNNIGWTNAAFAVLAWTGHPLWTANIPGAQWIWKEYQVSDPTHDTTVQFMKKFNSTSDSTATFVVASDNTYNCSVNAFRVVSTAGDNYQDSTKDNYEATGAIINGVNTIACTVKNIGVAGTTYQTNPAGLKYRLDVNPRCTPSYTLTHSPANPGVGQVVNITSSANANAATTKIYVDGVLKQTCTTPACSYANTYTSGEHSYSADYISWSGMTTHSETKHFTVAAACAAEGHACTADSQCCAGLSCSVSANSPTAGTCQAPTVQEVVLGEEFTLNVGESAQVTDYNNMQLTLIQAPVCSPSGPTYCTGPAGELVYHVTVSLPMEQAENTAATPPAMQLLLKKGVPQTVYGVTVTLLDGDTNSATLVVQTKPIVETVQDVHLGDEFTLHVDNVARVTDYNNMAIHLTAIIPECSSGIAGCTTAAFAASGYYVTVEYTPQAQPGQTVVPGMPAQLILKPGVPQTVFGARITLLGGDTTSGRFKVEAETTPPSECAAENEDCTADIQCCDGLTCSSMTEGRGTCTGETPPPLPAQTYTLNFKKGWNMFSVPVTTQDKTLRNWDTTCTFSSVLWQLNAEGQNFQRTNEVLPGRGYWIKAADDCTVNVPKAGEVNLADYPIDMSPGWNLIGSQLETIDFSAIQNDCDITRGPFAYDTQAHAYVTADQMEPGKGYLIKVPTRCTLSTESTAPPTLPPETEVCTQEVKICPGGSYVGRNPDNNCDFDPCPSTTETAETTTQTTNTASAASAQTTPNVPTSAAQMAKRISIDAFTTQSVTIRNIGTGTILPNEVVIYVNGVLRACSPALTSIVPGAVQICSLNIPCGSGMTMRVISPGNVDQVTC